MDVLPEFIEIGFTRTRVRLRQIVRVFGLLDICQPMTNNRDV